MKRKWVSVLVLAMMVAGGVFAQEGDATHKHSAGDMLLGLNWGFLGTMMNTDPVAAFSDVASSLDFNVNQNSPTDFSINATIDLPKFFTTARILNLGLSYEYYVFHWMSVGTGLGVSPEVNVVTKGGRTGISVTGATTEDAATEAAISKAMEVVHVQAGLFLTIPFNVHFNIPKVEWLYAGLGAEIHIPVSDLGLDDIIGADIAKYLPGGSIMGKTFVSMPIDLGFDFSRIKKNGKPARSRLLLRVEPEFFGDGMVSLPLSLVWQSSLWKLANAAIPGTK
ncbi:hypothetical protein AGMMS49944_17500 [Spirochaetia bacterium]|nr:hypothetical protein AGMMS49944_17500 [Spirochaetia bacterium]